MPWRPKVVTSRPVFASSATSWKPGEIEYTRGASPAMPLRQYATPRPEWRRGADVPRAPSSRRYIHSVSPLVASIATTVRRTPAVVYSTPSAITGVTR